MSVNDNSHDTEATNMDKDHLDSPEEESPRQVLRAAMDFVRHLSRSESPHRPEGNGPRALYPKKISARCKVVCESCGAVFNVEYIPDRMSKRLALGYCDRCTGLDHSLDLSIRRHVVFQSGRIHDPDTPLSSCKGYIQPEHPVHIAMIEASNFVRSSLGVSACDFLCRTSGPDKGVLRMNYRYSSIRPLIPDDFIHLKVLRGIDKKRLVPVVASLGIGTVADIPTFKLESDKTIEEVAWLKGILPNNATTCMTTRSTEVWGQLYDARYKATIGSRSFYFYPSHLIARLFVKAGAFDEIRRLLVNARGFRALQHQIDLIHATAWLN